MPEGTKGWTYFTGIPSTQQYAADPITACQLSAQNHMGTPLLAMRATPGGNSGFLDCKYEHMLGVPKGGEWYGIATLECESGYAPRWPGVCGKRNEPPAPLPDPGCCVPETAGFALGNPVQLASGAKVQTETDLVAGPHDLLEIQRTYRTMRTNWGGQSAGMGWSFSFDRQFVLDRFNIGAPFVAGTFGDGSAFAFDLLPGDKLVSRWDKRISLKALDTAYSEWLLTAADGHVERYKNFNGTFLMVSSHGAAGGSASYSYDADNHLKLIAHSDGRQVKIGWHAGFVDTIDGPEGSVRYEYVQASVTGQADIEGMARLQAVHLYSRDGVLAATRRYHYDHATSPYLLTGITDENRVRFATYDYNEVAQATVSEHAGGVGRYTFSYPSELTRRTIDPLGTERNWEIIYASDRRGRVASESQPAGAGSAPASSAYEYTNRGELASHTDFNGNKTCYVTDAVRGLESRRIAGLRAET